MAGLAHDELQRHFGLGLGRFEISDYSDAAEVVLAGSTSTSSTSTCSSTTSTTSCSA
ncbi:thiazolylpeptide-type bacteriocin [Nonomuraea turcica]|uniref:thiazolylpeptide-type bacteriocin n=1 Tax=Nonomuraea sp. G32 TaxID=3067274 RepID=UPI00273B2C1C|nr:thiazolylpeptide-type bacteriocin [Nonomuraea sp. G32]MDP4511246.1 thiazolylpeptide-type bacteriocin [Nonomuraea sp. G32]